MLHVPSTLARLIVIVGTFAPFPMYFLGARLSDRFGRRKVTSIGYEIAVLTFFPGLHVIADSANPALTQTWRDHPVIVSGLDCSYDPFAAGRLILECGRVVDGLSTKGVPCSTVEGVPGARPMATVGGVRVEPSEKRALDTQLALAGYSDAPVVPTPSGIALILLAMAILYVGAGTAYGAMAAWLVELFPSRTRYKSLSISYHIAVGYAGGFMPLISQYIVAKTGDRFAGF